MKTCLICGKSVAWYRIYVDDVEVANNANNVDMCQGHYNETHFRLERMIAGPSLEGSITLLPNCKCTLEPESTPIPQVFLDAFKDDEAS